MISDPKVIKITDPSFTGTYMEYAVKGEDVRHTEWEYKFVFFITPNWGNWRYSSKADEPIKELETYARSRLQSVGVEGVDWEIKSIRKASFSVLFKERRLASMLKLIL